MKFFKKMDHCSKGEQLFILAALCVLALGILCLSGCGGSRRNQGCEGAACSKAETQYYEATGCSIPGCGGCLTSGRGCGSVLWPQSCKFIHGHTTDELKTEYSRVTACDTQYYGGCLGGCGHTLKSCYVGCGRYSDDDESMGGLFYGSSTKSHTCGCVNGCGGCVKTGTIWRDYLDRFESTAKIS